jgi:hypothetical protein
MPIWSASVRECHMRLLAKQRAAPPRTLNAMDEEVRAAAPPEGPEVGIGITSGLWPLRFVLAGPHSDGTGGLLVPVRLEAAGLTARTTMGLEEWSGSRGRLIAYFEDLAAGWRGWAGAKEWRDDSARVFISASHDGKALAVLAVRLGNATFDGPGYWSARVGVPVELGALGPVAAAVRRLIG